MADLLIQEFKRTDLAMVRAKTGQEGVDEFKKTLPDLILLDLVLPDMKGFDALRQIRRLPGGPEVKVIIFSNLSENVEREEARRLGAIGYMVKANTELKEVIEKIYEVLNIS